MESGDIMRVITCILLFLICSCTSMKRTEHLTNPELSSFYPMTIQALEVVCVDTLHPPGAPRNPVGPQRPTFPPYPRNEITYVYEVFISVKLPYADMIWDQPFYVEVELPTEKKHEVAFNEECDRLYGDLQNDFGFLLKTTKKGLSQFTLGFIDELDDVQYDFYNPFRSKEVRLN